MNTNELAAEAAELLKTILSFPSTVTPKQIERMIEKLESCAAHASEPYKHEYTEHLPETDAAAHVSEPPLWKIMQEFVQDKAIPVERRAHYSNKMKSVGLAPPAHTTSEPWTTDDCIKIIGDSMRTDVIIQKLKHAHNATLQPAHASEQGADTKRLTNCARTLAMLILQTSAYPENYEIRKAVDDIIVSIMKERG